MSAISDLLIGVLRIQGGWKAHVRALERAGCRTRAVRARADLDGIDGLILPGGESTAITTELLRCGLEGPLRELVLSERMPVLGTCAGAILLAGRVGEGWGWTGEGGYSVVRNAYGAHDESWAEDVELQGVGRIPAYFIRPPALTPEPGWVVLARDKQGEPVALSRGRLTALSFHPELGGHAVHRWFASKCAHAKLHRRL